MKVPTICHICSYGPEYGGTFIESLLFLSRYCRDNLQLATFCIFPEKAMNRSWLSKLDNEGIGYGFVPHKRNVLQEVRTLLSDCEPIVIHTHFFLFDLTAILLKCTAFKKAKVVWHYHSQPPSTLLQQIRDRIKAGLIFSLWGARCIAVGDGVFRSLINTGLSRSKLLLIHNAVNTNRFTSNSLSRDRTRQSLKVVNDVNVFLLLGYAPHIKGVDIFVRAAAEVSARNRSAMLFVIVGRGETRRFVSSMPCASQLGDSLLVIDPVEDFPLLLNGVDVLVSASRTEGFGFAVIEAMAEEKLILCSDIEPVRQTYGRSDGVWLFPTEDWKQLAGLMEKACRLSPDATQLFGSANRRYVIENHSLEQWSEKVGQVYKELIHV